MCRLLVVNNRESDPLMSNTQHYIHLLNLPVDLRKSESWDTALQQLDSGSKIDIILCYGAGTQYELARKLQPWLKFISVRQGSPIAGTPCADIELPQDMGIYHFYQALRTLDPKTACSVRLPCHSESVTPPVFNHILSVLQIIESEYREDIGLEYIAQKIFISPCYLSTLFSRFMGVSLLSYLNGFRMKKAVELLLHSDQKVREICQNVGYRNLPYFCTVFKNRHGMTPAQFRREYAQLPT